MNWNNYLLIVLKCLIVDKSNLVPDIRNLEIESSLKNILIKFYLWHELKKHWKIVCNITKIMKNGKNLIDKFILILFHQFRKKVKLLK